MRSCVLMSLLWLLNSGDGGKGLGGDMGKGFGGDGGKGFGGFGGDAKGCGNDFGRGYGAEKGGFDGGLGFGFAKKGGKGPPGPPGPPRPGQVRCGMKYLPTVCGISAKSLWNMCEKSFSEFWQVPIDVLKASPSKFHPGQWPLTTNWQGNIRDSEPRLADASSGFASQ